VFLLLFAALPLSPPLGVFVFLIEIVVLVEIGEGLGGTVVCPVAEVVVISGSIVVGIASVNQTMLRQITGI